LDTLNGGVDRLDRHGRQEQPRDGLHLGGWRDFTDLHGPEHHGRQALRFAMRRGTQGQGTIAQRSRRFPGGLRAATRDVQEELGRHRLGRDRRPHIPLWRVDTAIPGGAHEQINACRAGRCQDVRDIGFPVADAEHMGRGTAVARGGDGVKTVEPRLTFLLAEGALLAPSPFPDVVRVPRPDLWGQETQGDPLRRAGQRGMDQQAVTGGVSQWPEAFGSAQVRPVGFGRIVHGQDNGHRVETTRGRLDMALDDIVGRHVIVGQKALGGFEHRPAPTGFRQCGPGTLGERMGQLDQTLGPPQVAEISVGTLRDGPTRGIEKVAHVCFLVQRVEPEVKVENPCPS